MEQLIEFGLFFLKTAVIVLAILVVISNIVAASLKSKDDDKNKVKFKNKSKEFRKRKLQMDLLFLDSKAAKKAKKVNEKKLKQDEKEIAKDIKTSKKLFLMSFNGDIKASQTENLSHEITHVLECAKPNDEVLLRLESPGGMVSGYGLAASELKRIKDAGIKLNIVVDKVAASGGYMMACVGDHIMAAPFSIIGSIGVVAQIPNFNKLLKKNDIDYEIVTAGKYKRTLTVFGENTDEGRAKFKDQLEDIHILFKDFVSSNRPKLKNNIEDVATGEYWFGEQCLEKNLIDEITTSEDYLFKNKDRFEIYEVSTEKKKSFVEKISESAAHIIVEKIERLSLWKGI